MEPTVEPEQTPESGSRFVHFWLIVIGLAAGLAVEFGVAQPAWGLGGPVLAIAVMAIPPAILFMLQRSFASHPLLGPLFIALLGGAMGGFLLALISAAPR